MSGEVVVGLTWLLPLELVSGWGLARDYGSTPWHACRSTAAGSPSNRDNSMALLPYPKARSCLRNSQLEPALMLAHLIVVIPRATHIH